MSYLFLRSNYSIFSATIASYKRSNGVLGPYICFRGLLLFSMTNFHFMFGPSYYHHWVDRWNVLTFSWCGTSRRAWLILKKDCCNIPEEDKLLALTKRLIQDNRIPKQSLLFFASYNILRSFGNFYVRIYWVFLRIFNKLSSWWWSQQRNAFYQFVNLFYSMSEPTVIILWDVISMKPYINIYVWKQQLVWVSS